MQAHIKAIEYYLPDRIVTNEDLIKDFPEWSVEKIIDKIGVEVRHVAGEQETATDMAIAAALKLFEQKDIKKESIDYLLFCTQSPDYLLPTSACIIQEKLGLPKQIGALDFNQGCSGFIYGLSLAKGLIYAGIATNILLLTAETYTKFLHKKDKGNRTIFGDAATATLISTDGFAELGDFCLGTDGSGARNLIVETGGARNPKKSDIITFDENNNPVSADYLYMDGSEIFSFTLNTVPSLIAGVISKNKISTENVDLYIFHQANKYMLDFLQKKLKIDKEKFYYCLSKFGNTVSSTIPIAICESLRDGTLRKNMNIVLVGFGVGYSWGGTIIKLN